MKVTKFGHCCMLVEEDGVRILFDPGNLSTGQNQAKNIHVILITHEHQDHLHIDSLKKVLQNNPTARVITNSGVGKLLTAEKITHEVLENGKWTTQSGVGIEGFGNEHAEIYAQIGRVQNTGFMITGTVYFPGDSFFLPNKPVEILALPVAGPWMRLSEAIDYALAVKPKACFPVHDGILKSPGSAHRVPAIVLAEHGIRFVVIEEGTTAEF